MLPPFFSPPVFLSYRIREALRIVHDLAACNLVHLGCVGDGGITWKDATIEKPYCATQWFNRALDVDDVPVPYLPNLININDTSKTNIEFCKRLRKAYPHAFETAFK